MTADEVKKQYDYLDQYSYEDGDVYPWIWEFVRRNSEYRALFEQLSRLLPHAPLHLTGPVYGDSDTFLGSGDERTQQIITAMGEKFGIKPNARVTADRDGNYLKATIPYAGTISEVYTVGFPNPAVRYCDFTSKPVIQGGKPIASAVFNERAASLRERNPDRFNRYCAKVIEKISPSRDIRNTIYIGISRHARKEFLREKLEEILDSLQKPGARLRKELWKYYLAVYDLRTSASPQMKFKDISDILSDAYHLKELKSEITLQKYFTKCNTYIESGFLKFMYLQ